MSIKKFGLASTTLLAISISSHAQVPVIGNLLAGFENGTLSLDSLVLNTFPVQFLSSSPLSSLSALTSLGSSVLTNPQTLLNLGTTTGLPILQDLIPPVDILTTDPTALPNYLLSGGTILAPALGATLPIPVLVIPL